MLDARDHVGSSYRDIHRYCDIVVQISLRLASWTHLQNAGPSTGSASQYGSSDGMDNQKTVGREELAAYNAE